MSSQSVLVIGGGLAGLACAVALAESGVKVRVFEKRPHLGGRATSYTLPDGSEVDNCQHVTLGCCTNLADFYRRADAGQKIRFYDRLYFADREGRRSTIAASMLPPPLHMAPSFVGFGALGLADKAGIAKALMTIARAGGKPSNGSGVTMLDWLHRMGQTPDAIERFWRVVLVSALDEELSRMDAGYGIDVFWKAFLGSRGGYRIGIPSVPLGELYEGCRDAIVRKGGEVRLRCGVREIRVSEKRFAGATLEDGTEISANACVAAVPHEVLPGLLPAAMGEEGGMLAGLQHIRTSPITGVHLWFDRAVMKEPFLALLDHTTQWIFNKTLLYAHAGTNGDGPSKGQYLQLVISASYDLVPRSRQDIIDVCRRELEEVLPATREAKLEKATVIKEVHATFSPEPGVDQWRPAQKTGVEGLFLAGDWTRTGWPSTMEGAVRSGYLAAEETLVSFGDPRKFVQADVAFEGLSKIWAKRAQSSLS
ncbi:MAG TPA: hydroxysqualene dehydroxylase HpnE [Candidatus Acidoferrales bacterium]|jgi:zeta-carotene desaturase|nr:hydroxysqualene dehydroxylase HpnE [Candidatus Acidoferrales bacterium]